MADATRQSTETVRQAPRHVRVILAGYGTVGRAFHTILAKNKATIEAKHGVSVDVVAVCRSQGAWVTESGMEPRPLALDERRDMSVSDVLREVEADVLVELTPTDLETGGAALENIRTAIDKGLHVVTANKGPVVLDLPGLKERAAKNGVELRFEATAGAAIPIMSLADFCLRGNPVTRIEGVLNGTCNYILTRMGEEGLGFDEALFEAQSLGYAEADPAADVDGWDAAAKVVILANHVLGRPLSLKDVQVTGIRAVTGEAVQLARKQGYALRLVGAVGLEGPATVAPRLVPLASPLNVQGTLNVMRLHTAYAGPIALSGHGAGGTETASAVLADLLALPW
ncbi:MAG: homoserine dehydrogenase [Euryarchaeota archaeon]|nr:homoserine dehydrogenase [Euryarchaeota archaeon]